jgi:hypothetical protein
MIDWLPAWARWAIAAPLIVGILFTWCCVSMADRGGSDDE